MEIIAKRPEALTKVPFHYCPGCMHGVAHRLIAEAIDENGLINQIAGVAPVGCAVFAYNYFNCDMAEAAHGRAPAVATGIKRARPDMHIFTYQGDGDLAAIGTAEIVHSANRGEKISVFFVNNAIYGMTGGQMAPTTLPNMKTTTSPYGRNVDDIGYPIRMCELLATLVAPYYIERVSLLSPADIIKAKKAVNKAIRYNKENRGFTFIEFISTCPTNWGYEPEQARQWAKENMLPFFKLGVYRDKGEGVE
ncbi:MAG TPA: thiamine pyrophosphate-dependent enzyme [Candidatus Cloacimonas acidaminovorans]|jgi:2-oxoglutarate ferredoxin oxidoreductase subunit beta|uniref:Pyruvate:ferredoxin and related 2-oxoacid:ferredoxin oxidoreductases, beta subunit n=1 Tax=Cloacimonas acidaminovorans (strain Evry) TaxID=459349 RepID=B0VHR0_CLOAI|nr:thiamine pyrophosphate-dependent enzyme [Candidatus Cloacimonas acidaminovorans]MBP8705810.1 2-oxoglutarate oxidoreductase [Candidatus Cloacimonas sp.]MDD3605798.1 thiamine pyrophosphate-dependent enzyme [Candidatus Cloacimonas acidaminovorans]MDY0218651.1 thiamine pyrophosphate-dependent enzyme [Candidatus Cloacimonas acidaminovorans]CAO80875.1 pyruvate:ferredoxin and related 2-oxoacid:ferredoxin oxidoreductases, beta subunit [Candidatus Cloacimonas acidaminovorans str. Evry]HNV62645.1 thi